MNPAATTAQAINNVAKMTTAANAAVANMATKATAMPPTPGAAPQMGGRRRNRKSKKNTRKSHRKSKKNTRKSTRRNRH